MKLSTLNPLRKVRTVWGVRYTTSDVADVADFVCWSRWCRSRKIIWDGGRPPSQPWTETRWKCGNCGCAGVFTLGGH